MATSLTGNLTVDLGTTYLNTLDLSSPTDVLAVNKQWALTNGVGDDQADVVWHDQRTLAATTSESLDLYGSLTGPLGVTVNMVKVKALYIENLSTLYELKVGGAASEEWTSWVGASGDKVYIKPGGALLLVAPKAAGYSLGAAGANAQLKIENTGAGECTYNIVVVGALS